MIQFYVIANKTRLH